MVEFWEDKVATQIEITNLFIDPLIHTALRRKKGVKRVDEVDKGDETLLDHLVQQTDGTSKFLNHCPISRSKGVQISTPSGTRP